MNSLTVTAIVAIVAFAFVLTPLLRRGRSGASLGARDDAGGGASDSATRESALDAQLDELELDRAMGKLEATDFEKLRASLVTSSAATPAVGATVAMNDVGTLPGGSAPTSVPNEDALPTDEELDRYIAHVLVEPVRCNTCGERPEPGAVFCSSCGTRIGGCPTCGAEQPAADAKFCTSCGAALNA